MHHTFYFQQNCRVVEVDVENPHTRKTVKELMICYPEKMVRDYRKKLIYLFHHRLIIIGIETTSHVVIIRQIFYCLI